MKPATTEDVFDLMDSYLTSAALNTALELGLFWLLAKQPMEVAEVAKELGIPKNRCQYWMQLLSSTGLLEKVSNGYAASSTAKTTILDAYSQGTWANLALEAHDQYPVILDLTQHIHEAGSAWEAMGLVPPDYFEQLVEDPARAGQFTRMLYEIHLTLADELAESLDMSGVERMMDLGGGSGVMSLALLRRYPQLTSLVVDVPNVCATGRDIAKESSMEERIGYHEANFLQDELPSGYDMVLECDVGVYNEALFGKIWAALNPSGRLVVVDQFAPLEGVAPANPPYQHWAFEASMENPDFSFPTVSDIRTWLERAGFQLLSTENVAQIGKVRWSDGWVKIEACK